MDMDIKLVILLLLELQRLLPYGRTLHNRFGLSIPLFSDSISHIGPRSQAWQELQQIAAFIVDEASMIPNHVLPIIDNLMRQVTQQPDELFGNKLFLLGGDFCQILPIQQPI